ncbi:helix-turn-helix transcriptional regulator [Streptomyces albidoflavus]|uniref:helix-turn-helix transcriptional regulator n=1 Tax=Streptomyces albidoflavus TaxID=1886 RepID=UPI001F5C7A34|nr:helix-turn-helix domain-containing protein [Streptomyces albidoflavus]
MPRNPHAAIPAPRGSMWIADAADYLGLSIHTLYKWRQLDTGPRSFAVGRKVAYRIDVLDAYLDSLQAPRHIDTAPTRRSRRTRKPAAA